MPYYLLPCAMWNICCVEVEPYVVVHNALIPFTRCISCHKPCEVLRRFSVLKFKVRQRSCLNM
uniref:Uncharacterized protein n=1 Tax=Aegilops tauschii subsp. strangulata TaxID=200361 RepID=A0A453NBF2_AEGTS